MTGGSGSDRSDFTDLEGTDTIRDFGFLDKLVFSRDDFANSSEVLSAFEQDGDDGVVAIGDDRVVLEDTTVQEVSTMNVQIA